MSHHLLNSKENASPLIGRARTISHFHETHYFGEPTNRLDQALVFVPGLVGIVVACCWGLGDWASCPPCSVIVDVVVDRLEIEVEDPVVPSEIPWEDQVAGTPVLAVHQVPKDGEGPWVWRREDSWD